jgi:hypothetical protein
MIGNRGGTPVGVAKELVAAALANLHKAYGFEKAD